MTTLEDLYRHHPDIKAGFRRACENGLLEHVEYLAQNFEVDAAQFDSYCLVVACSEGHFDIVRFLLTNETVTNKPSVRARNQEALVAAVDSGNLSLVQYLMTSPELSEHCDFGGREKEIFESAIKYTAVLEYLIIYHDLEKSLDLRYTKALDIIERKNERKMLNVCLSIPKRSGAIKI